MRGHEPIISMRKSGKRPAIVFVNDFADPVAKDWHNPGEKYGETWPPDHATVSVDGDAVQLLDLRFLKGLRVSISSLSEARAKALFDRCKSSGASVVAAAHTIRDGAFVRSGWAEIYHAEDAKNG